MERNHYIVIAETDDLIRELLERWLGEAGYAVVREVARDAPRPHPPVLVIVDVASPLQAQTVICSLQAMYLAPILALSARFRRGLGESTSAARRLGVRKVLPKPFTRAELLGAVRDAIRSDDEARDG